MQTLLDMQNELTSRLGVASNSTKFPLSRIKTLVKDAHLWATSLFPFRELTLETDVLFSAGTTSSFITGAKDFTYPTAYRSNSVWLIFIGSNEYKKRNFDDLLRYALANPNSAKRRFADLGRKYIVFPTPTSGTLKVYGQQQATQLSADGDTTIFSSANDEGNEAIVLKAFQTATNNQPVRVRGGVLIGLEGQAIDILSKIFAVQKDNSQFDLPMAKPIFDVPDFFPTRKTNPVLSFSNIGSGDNDSDF